MKYLLSILAACVLALGLFSVSSSPADAQGTPLRLGKVTLYNSTVALTAKLVIPAASVGSGPMNFDVCHDAASTDSYISIGFDSAVATGYKLKPGVCWSCPYCSAGVLTGLYVLGTASGGTAYTVVQYRQ